MCTIGYHNCQECGEEIPCYQRDEECVINQVCERCDYWLEELYREEERKAEVAREARERWEWEHES